VTERLKVLAVFLIESPGMQRESEREGSILVIFCKILLSVDLA
jgi:hypothetical protein